MPSNKEQLYLAVLEKLYGDIRTTDAALKLDQQDPEAALRRMVEFTFEHHDSNVDFIRLVSIENIHHAEHLAESQVIRSLNKSILAEVAKILDRGVAAGIFRPGIEPRDLRLLISSFCFFRVSNRHTFATIHQVDFTDPETRAAQGNDLRGGAALRQGLRDWPRHAGGMPWGETVGFRPEATGDDRQKTAKSGRSPRLEFEV